MAKYRKRPIVVEATQWFKNGDHPEDYTKDHDGREGGLMRVFTGAERKANGWEGDVVRYYRRPDDSGERVCEHCGRTMHVHGWIDTIQGGHTVCPGDWIITDPRVADPRGHGHFYPCKPDIFADTYDPVE